MLSCALRDVIFDACHPWSIVIARINICVHFFDGVVAWIAEWDIVCDGWKAEMIVLPHYDPEDSNCHFFREYDILSDNGSKLIERYYIYVDCLGSTQI